MTEQSGTIELGALFSAKCVAIETWDGNSWRFSVQVLSEQARQCFVVRLVAVVLVFQAFQS